MRAKQMLATMSHEIRSPLSGVVSMAEIFSTTNLDKEQRQLLSVMLSSGDLVLQLINDILDLSKVESGEGLDIGLWGLLTLVWISTFSFLFFFSSTRMSLVGHYFCFILFYFYNPI
ncbi:unnamed protein product [Camellia sinensis]